MVNDDEGTIESKKIATESQELLVGYEEVDADLILLCSLPFL
jgi:hypothetical protein